MKAMILAAGLGTRFKPWTDSHPKALAMVNGKTLLERNILYLQQFGIRDVIVNVHHFAGQILETVQSNQGWGSAISISDESGELLETGGGLRKAAAYFDEGPFILMNVDILTNMNLHAMIVFHEKNKPLATLAVTDRKSSRYFLFDDLERLVGWRNAKTGEVKMATPDEEWHEKAFSGIHCISPEIFSYLPGQGKFSIVDNYLDIARSQVILGFDHSGSSLVDVGRPESVSVAERLFP